MNKKENPGVSRRGAAMLLLFSLAVSVLLGFAMPVHAADGGRTTLRTLRVGFYPYTGYMATAADGSRSGYAYELLQDIAQHENVTFAYSCLDGNTHARLVMNNVGRVRVERPRAAVLELDDFLRLSGRELLTHGGRVSHADALQHAQQQYDLWRKQRATLPQAVDRDFDAATHALKPIATQRKTPRTPKDHRA